jgi:hypothetical protein
LGYRDFSRNELTILLRTDPDRFSNIAGFMQSNLNATREDLTISLGQLLDLELREQLYLLIVYASSTDKLPFLSSELNSIYHLLVEVNSLGHISKRRQAIFLDIFRRLGEWHICQRIMEHQIRSDLLRLTQIYQKYRQLETQQFIRIICEKLNQLKIFILSMDRMCIKYNASRVRAVSIISYLRALPIKHKRKFYEWLLSAPLSQPPEIERTALTYLTSTMLENNREWFLHDPVVRFYLFREAIKELGQIRGRSVTH